MLPVYAALLPWLQMAARHHGYALLVHGSTTRDLDLVAVPWVADVASASDLIAVLRQVCGGRVAFVSQPVRRPHGRRAFVALLHEEQSNGQLCYLDISVMSREEKQG